ncbi:hypothetical protein ALO71_200142 [Pseudomonas amygdali pv. dendropanacis]|uniref:Histidine kinase n=1 Tax=Pseudomonas amygdali pv. dendropanacis TaxID=235272 RepID=A0A0P9Q5F1_PSEA0|nr:hypothetical protein ALO71_200142 [Pseudomonas amygdali pv. dendropanacis]
MVLAANGQNRAPGSWRSPGVRFTHKGVYAGIPENSVGKHHKSGSRLLLLSDTVFRTYLAAQSSRFRLGGVAAGKQLFGVNPHPYWLPNHDGNFWDSGLQPRFAR